MYADDMIAMIDRLKPNGVDYEDKLRWLHDCEMRVYREMVLTHENPDGITVERGCDGWGTELILPSPHTDVYRFYVEAQIDLANMELNKYENSKTLFNSAWYNAANWYNATHMPVGPAYINLGRRRRG